MEKQEIIHLESLDAYLALFGANDQHIALLERLTGVRCSLREKDLMLTGEEEQLSLAADSIRMLLKLVRRHEAVDKNLIRYVVTMLRDGKADVLEEMLRDVVAITYRGRPIKCKTSGQHEYVNAIRDHALTFGVGPAGTGKTYLAMALAVAALRDKQVERIVLTRPAVEAGEKLGFLPGDMNQKVDPYLRPLYDAMYDMMGAEAAAKLQERGVVEVAPLAYMRGRTLNDSFIILDEAQNTTTEQMKMFLTRMGVHSKAVVTGDMTQIDLPIGKKSGLKQAVEILDGIPEIAIVRLQPGDVVRHELVQAIVEAYEKSERKKEERTE